jgi:hypothetical protein
MDSARNYHAEIMNAFASGDAIRLATIANELASELAAVTTLANELRARRESDAARQRKRYGKTHVRSREVTSDHVTVSSPLDGPLSSAPDPTNSLPLIPSTSTNVASRESTLALVGANGKHNGTHSEDYDADFESWWGDYPSDGRGNKRAAWKAWKARKRDGHGVPLFFAGLTRYKAYLAATGRYPKNASTFLGPDLHFLDMWDVPPSLLNGGKPRGNSADDEVARNKALGARIDERRRKADGEEWWAWVERAAQMRGARNHRDVLLFADKHLEDVYAET